MEDHVILIKKPTINFKLKPEVTNKPQIWKNKSQKDLKKLTLMYIVRDYVPDIMYNMVSNTI